MSYTERTRVLLGNGATGNTADLVLTPDASWQVDDIAAVALSWSSTQALTPPAGWSLVTGAAIVNGTQTGAIAFKTLTAPDLLATHTFTIAAATRYVGVATAIAGADGAVDSSAASAGTIGGTTLDAPTDTTVQVDAFLLSFWSARTNSAASPTFTAPGSHGAISNSSTALAGTTTQSVVALATLLTQPHIPGAYGPYTAALSIDADRSLGMQVAFGPAGGGGPIPNIFARVDGEWVPVIRQVRVDGLWSEP